MSTDAGSPIAPRAPFSLDLPPIRKLQIRRISFDPPKLEYFESSLSRYKGAIEFIAETDGEVPVRAYGPALFVGDVELNQSERVGKTTWRWLVFEPEHLEAGAPISWGWMKDPETARQRTKFRYKVEGGRRSSRAKP
jgi:hypothetical protein